MGVQAAGSILGAAGKNQCRCVTCKLNPMRSLPTIRAFEAGAVVVSGGATGIGEALVTVFARQGARVAFFDILDEPAEALAARLKAEGCPEPLYLSCDLTNIDALKAAAARAADALGTVDVLVNNAANDARHRIEDVTAESFDRSMAVNLRPQVFLIQAGVACDAGERSAGRLSI